MGPLERNLVALLAEPRNRGLGFEDVADRLSANPDDLERAITNARAQGWLYCGDAGYEDPRTFIRYCVVTDAGRAALDA